MAEKISVEEALEAINLGDPDDVAAFLRAGGYKGNPDDSCNCPIAAYLKDKTGQYVEVGPSTVSYGRAEGATLTIVALPPKAANFVTMFDNHDYVELDPDPPFYCELCQEWGDHDESDPHDNPVER